MNWSLFRLGFQNSKRSTLEHLQAENNSNNTSRLEREQIKVIWRHFVSSMTRLCSLTVLLLVTWGVSYQTQLTFTRSEYCLLLYQGPTLSSAGSNSTVFHFAPPMHPECCPTGTWSNTFSAAPHCKLPKRTAVATTLCFVLSVSRTIDIPTKWDATLEWDDMLCRRPEKTQAPFKMQYCNLESDPCCLSESKSSRWGLILDLHGELKSVNSKQNVIFQDFVLCKKGEILRK